MRLLTALFENTTRAGLARGRFSGAIWRQSGVLEGFVLSPFLFALAFSPAIKALRNWGGRLRCWDMGRCLLAHG